MALFVSFDLLTINDLNNEILHKVYKKVWLFCKIDIHEIGVLVEFTRIVIFLLIMLPLSFNALGSIFLVISASDIMGFCFEGFHYYHCFLVEVEYILL
jgi:hypothetical protein